MIDRCRQVNHAGEVHEALEAKMEKDAAWIEGLRISLVERVCCPVLGLSSR